ncbi:DUF3793 family protein [Eubacterium sp. am_0171]|uniref:DUF3793 family protein n=1 Tax=unclassified Eubacterium (in: firmicutes) TaxID=2624479 RepID=UPI00101FA12B|nr:MULTISPECIES: DUF3793 family protein [unclassified Eubacterium (in: firmicutes)]MSC84843.1 DUF3793 family protein [Eubacterium sp. BIOML-A1]MSD07466.1 DUF3793 family protein [Eubacterium sp. BIOML-A2]RYT14941.1 DUF3793 family protein [Eubacterium sp. am_0171]
MPAEVLSYFLKHEDIRLKLRFQIVLQCAPFLKGKKVSCGITMEDSMYDELYNILGGSGISYRRLSAAEGRCLVLFYRDKELSEYLNRVGIRSFIREFGYIEMGLDEMLERLSCRTALFSREEIGYPHEIGIFFGYPVEDVQGFIRNAGREYLFLGYWKVYSNPMAAKMIFKEYDQAKVCAVNEFLTGKSIKDIARNKED